MSRFTQPEHGNSQRLGSPINSAKNLQRKLNRQRRERAERSHQKILNIVRRASAQAIAKATGAA